MEQYAARETYGIRHGERANSLKTRYNTHLARDSMLNFYSVTIQMLTRSERHALRRHRSSPLQAIDIEDDDSILFQASSSGFVPPAYKPRVRRSISSEGSRGRSRSTQSPSRIALD